MRPSRIVSAVLGVSRQHQWDPYQRQDEQCPIWITVSSGDGGRMGSVMAKARTLQAGPWQQEIEMRLKLYSDGDSR